MSKNILSTFSGHETDELTINFPGGETPGLPPKGRPRLTRRGASNAGEGERRGRGKGGRGRRGRGGGGEKGKVSQ
jgi:hypothetical protein